MDLKKYNELLTQSEEVIIKHGLQGVLRPAIMDVYDEIGGEVVLSQGDIL